MLAGCGYWLEVPLWDDKKISCGYWLEAPQWGASNEYPQHIFCWEIRKIFTWYPLLSVAMTNIIILHHMAHVHRNSAASFIMPIVLWHILKNSKIHYGDSQSSDLHHCCRYSLIPLGQPLFYSPYKNPIWSSMRISFDNTNDISIPNNNHKNLHIHKMYKNTSNASLTYKIPKTTLTKPPAHPTDNVATKSKQCNTKIRYLKYRSRWGDNRCGNLVKLCYFCIKTYLVGFSLE